MSLQHPGDGKYICEMCGKRYANKRPFMAKCPECRQFPLNNQAEFEENMARSRARRIRRQLLEIPVFLLIVFALFYFFDDVETVISILTILVAIGVIYTLITFFVARRNKETDKENGEGET